MADEKALVIRAQKAPDARPRVHGVLVHRQERLRSLIDAQLAKDMGTIELSQHAFKDNDELAVATRRGRPLTNREKRIARAWEMSKKDAPVALMAAHERLINAQRAQQESKSLSINVERAVIRMPDTKEDDIRDAVILDGEPSAAR